MRSRQLDMSLRRLRHPSTVDALLAYRTHYARVARCMHPGCFNYCTHTDDVREPRPLFCSKRCGTDYSAQRVALLGDRVHRRRPGPRVRAKQHRNRASTTTRTRHVESRAIRRTHANRRIHHVAAPTRTEKRSTTTHRRIGYLVTCTNPDRQ